MPHPGHWDIHPTKELFEHYLEKIKNAPTRVKKKGILCNAESNRNITPEQYKELEAEYYKHV